MKPPESVRNSSADDERDLSSKREELLLQIEGWLEIPMLVLGFVWLALLIVELVAVESSTGDSRHGHLDHIHSTLLWSSRSLPGSSPI